VWHVVCYEWHVIPLDVRVGRSKSKVRCFAKDEVSVDLRYTTVGRVGEGLEGNYHTTFWVEELMTVWVGRVKRFGQ
jgi:hypothetical protein